ncbi:MAG: hypothetical protein HY300_20135 [Verrucomicrobia bacterium]|nr:hypothetical protein [Verrucomicrobiota bacterium]
MKLIRRFSTVSLLAATLAFAPAKARAFSNDEDHLIFSTMDLLVARPAGIGLIGAGTGLFLATLPFTVVIGQVGEARRTFIDGPWRATFRRKLGSTEMD